MNFILKISFDITFDLLVLRFEKYLRLLILHSPSYQDLLLTEITALKFDIDELVRMTFSKTNS
jgi:hypothetical protein